MVIYMHMPTRNNKTSIGVAKEVKKELSAYIEADKTFMAEHWDDALLYILAQAKRSNDKAA